MAYQKSGLPPGPRPRVPSGLVMLPSGVAFYVPGPGAAERSRQAAAELERRRRARERRAALGRLGLLEFFAQAWPIVEAGKTFASNWHLGAIADHLEAVTAGDIRDLIISMPPRSLKSRLVSVAWPAWEWAEVNPSTRWVFASYAHTLAKRDSIDCRRIIESTWYQRRYADVVQLRHDQNVQIRYENTRSGVRIATSVGGATTGEGGDRLVIDDPHNAASVESKAKREAVINWHDGAWLSRRNDPMRSSMVIVAQRTHHRDLIGHVLAAHDHGYAHLVLPLEYSPKRSTVTVLGWKDPRRREGELLHPERFDRAEAKKMRRRMGTRRFEAQYNQHTTDTGSMLVDRAWWRYWRVPPDGVDGIALSVDATFKKGLASDYVVIQVWLRRGADRFLFYQWREQAGFVATRKALVSLAEAYPTYEAILVEEAANGHAIIDELRSVLGGIYAVPPIGSKVSRAEAAVPQVETGNVYLPDPTLPGYAWVLDYLAEWDDFGEDAEHDDQVDATTQYLNWSRDLSRGGFVASRS